MRHNFSQSHSRLTLQRKRRVDIRSLILVSGTDTSVFTTSSMAMRSTWVSDVGVILSTVKCPELKFECWLPWRGETETVVLYCCYLSRLRGMLFNWANGPQMCFWYTEQVRGSLTYFESCSGGSRFQSEQGHDSSVVITTCPSHRVPMWYLKLLHPWYLTNSFEFNIQSHLNIWHYTAWIFFIMTRQPKWS